MKCSFCDAETDKGADGQATFFGDGSGPVAYFCPEHHPDNLPSDPEVGWIDMTGRRWWCINDEIFSD